MQKILTLLSFSISYKRKTFKITHMKCHTIYTTFIPLHEESSKDRSKGIATNCSKTESIKFRRVQWKIPLFLDLRCRVEVTFKRDVDH